MTVPIERTMAVLRTRRFLEELAVLQDTVDATTLRERAQMLLRHFPELHHLRVSAASAAEIWADPDDTHGRWQI